MAAPALSQVLSRPSLIAARALFILCALLAIPTDGFAKWRKIDPTELADTAARIDPEAGAEILEREVIVDQSSQEDIVRHTYVRAKIYSERGIGKFVKIEVPYDQASAVTDINVRTLKPDGQIIELARSDIYDREVVNDGERRVKVKSFAPPGLQPGDVVEYSYRQLTLTRQQFTTFSFQSDLPARLVRFQFRPARSPMGTLQTNAVFFNCPNQPLKSDSEGFFTFEMRDLAAAKPEPHQPPAISSNASVVVCYNLGLKLPPKEYWPDFAKLTHERYQEQTKPGKLIRSTLESIVSPTDNDEQKLRKIYDYCRSKIRNEHNDTDRLTREERAKSSTNATAADTLKNGYGSPSEIRVLYVALARAAGLEARLAPCNNRSLLQFNASIPEPFMLNELLVAVQLDGKWRYVDPAQTYLPFGMVSSRNEGTAVLVAAPKDGALALTPAAPPDSSQRQRKATLKLDADGALEGDVFVEYSGHDQFTLKWRLDGLGTAGRETFVRDSIQAHLKLAEITEIKIENASDPVAPLKISYHLRIPDYADRTGSRLFVQPSVFQKNVPPVFPEATRRTNLMFNHAYVHTDDIRILPPEGYELEEASAPASLNLGGLGSCEFSLSVVKRTGEIAYRRAFTLKATAVEKKFYEPVRAGFEAIHQRDGHTLTLRRKVAAPE